MIAGAQTLPGGRQARGWRWLVSTTVLVAGAGVLVAALFTAFGSDNPDELGWDYRIAYYPAGDAILDGRSPYPTDPTDPTLDGPRLYVYPPQLALLLSPLSALPIDLAVVLAVIGSLGALMGALALVGVRDVRCYAAVVIWSPGWNALEMANVSALLALLLALVWRFRDRLWPFATALGLMVSLKLFLWPVAAWAVAMRRVSGAVLGVLVGAGLTLASWAVIGFAGLGTYWDLLDRVATQESYSVKGMVFALGLGSTAAYAVMLVVGSSLLASSVWYARRCDGERSLLLAVVAALAMSPVVWLHYLVLFSVPLGLLRPRFGLLWLAPVLLWPLARSGNGEGIEPFVPALVVAVMVALLVVPEKADARSPAEAA